MFCSGRRLTMPMCANRTNEHEPIRCTCMPSFEYVPTGMALNPPREMATSSSRAEDIGTRPPCEARPMSGVTSRIRK